MVCHRDSIRRLLSRARPRPEQRAGRISATAILAATCALVAACTPGGHAGPEDTGPATLLVAVDGLDWATLLPAMRAGRTPNLLDLARRGSATRLTTFEPTDSPVIWTSVATGKTKEKHGITHFAESVRGHLVPVTANQRMVKAFWNILGEAHRSTAVIGWWVTWPAEPIHGWMVAPITSIGGRTWKGTLYAGSREQTWPPDLMEELRPLIDTTAGDTRTALDADLVPLPPTAPDWLREFRRDLGWSAISDAIFAAAAEQIARSHRPRILAVYQGAIDVAGHRFFGYGHASAAPLAEEVDDASAAAAATYLPAMVSRVDAAVGRLRAAMPPGTDVIVISDHGMHARRGTGQVATGRNPLARHNTGAHGDAPDGIWIAAGPSFAAPKPPFSPDVAVDDLPRLGDAAHPAVLDITPTLLYLHHLPVAEDMDGRVLTSVLVGQARTRPVQTVPTYETTPPPANRPAPIPSGADAATIERLRSLGYIE
ncbi:MAG: alkaline phosphatase family protein [Acidobacteriota bacterium]